MTRQLVWLDLCSGLGGASQPALDRGWKVIRVDIDPRFKPDIVADVRALPLKPFHVDVLWASPPCIEFARAELPWLKKKFPGLVPELDIARAVRAHVNFFDPDWWIIENTRNSLRYLRPLLGHEDIAIEGHYFWGVFPGLLPQARRIPKQNLWPSATRQAERAKIPYEIGEAICRAVETRTEQDATEGRASDDRPR